MFSNNLINQLNEKYQDIWALQHFLALGEWDAEVYMPTSGHNARGLATGKVEGMIQKLYLDDDFQRIIDAIDQKDLTDAEKGVYRVIKKKLDILKKVPPQFLEEYAQVTSESGIAWRDARKNNDFKSFSPYLEKVIDLKLREAEYIGYENHPYNALLDSYEEGMTVHEVEGFFTDIKPFLLETLQALKRKTINPRAIELAAIQYDQNKAEQLSTFILDYFNVDTNAFRIDVATHPFAEGVAKNEDVRITTRYELQNIGSAITSTIHEYGHALYEMQISEDILKTPISTLYSLGLHESQSRFWENIVGRSLTFCSIILPELHKVSDEYKKYNEQDLYDYLNLIKPGFIRVDADELTYHSHIMIRFEIEKALLSQEVKVSDAKEMWNSKYEEYLGLTPKTDSEGILQDIHWSRGLVGYFPTYSTGTILSATWKTSIEKNVGHIEKLARSADGIASIQSWLKEHVHKFGSTYTFNELVKHSTEEDFMTSHWKQYVTDKFLQ